MGVAIIEGSPSWELFEFGVLTSLLCSGLFHYARATWIERTFSMSGTPDPYRIPAGVIPHSDSPFYPSRPTRLSSDQSARQGRTTRPLQPLIPQLLQRTPFCGGRANLGTAFEYNY